MPDETMKPDKAMVLAAGLGTRMRPITDKLPKPLVKVYGKTLLDYGLDALEKSGVKTAVVNIHHLADQMEEHLAERKTLHIEISDERAELLDSGGGIKIALPHLGNDPFFLINADSFWLEGTRPNLEILWDSWDPSKMDILLLLSSMTNTVGYSGKGDFEMDSEGRLTRRLEKKLSPFAYSGAAILHPKIFEHAANGAFSLNRLFDEAIDNERLFGVRMEGLWLHVGTPEAIIEAEQAIARSAA